MVDERVFDDGALRVQVSIAGVDRDSGTVSATDFLLTIYAYETEPEVRPIFTHVMGIDEARRLYGFLRSISLLGDSAGTLSGRFVEIGNSVPDSVVDAFRSHPELADNPGLVRAVLEMNPELCRAILETEIDAIDVSSLAYRRGQLEAMRRLLTDSAFFEERRASIGATGKEAVWQDFFEQNQWIFGYGLSYVIGEGVQPSKLEQVVAGYSIAGAGKRADALLQTRGILRSLCYVEIKTHETDLVHGTEYRPDVWRPSNELVGAVAQSQKTVQLAAEQLTSVFDLPAGGGESGGERFFNYTPRSIVVCGRLDEFVEDDVTNVEKFSSFELYRRSLNSPEILTFDELLDRASAIVEARLAASDGGSVSELGATDPLESVQDGAG